MITLHDGQQISIEYSWSREAFEAWRKDRLEKAAAFVASLNKEALRFVARLTDSKGILEVRWSRPPAVSHAVLLNTAWESVGEDAGSVRHFVGEQECDLTLKIAPTPKATGDVNWDFPAVC